MMLENYVNPYDVCNTSSMDETAYSFVYKIAELSR